MSIHNESTTPRTARGQSRTRRTVYRSAIVSSISETEVEVLPDALLCVGPEGRIEWVEDLASRLSGGEEEGDRLEEDMARAVSEALEGHGTDLESVDFVWLEEGFLSPGFVDTHTVSCAAFHVSVRISGIGARSRGYDEQPQRRLIAQHAPQYINNGVGSDHQLMAWLKTVTFPTEQDFEDVEYARMVYSEVVRRSLRAGVSDSLCRMRMPS